jgi:hypothetical protein
MSVQHEKSRRQMMPAGRPSGGGQFEGERPIYHNGFKNI